MRAADRTSDGQGQIVPPPTRPLLTQAEKVERLAFTFCKLGTAGLLAWLLTPPLFVLLVALITIGLYGWAVTLGITRSKCVLRKPLLILGFWVAVAAADLTWLLVFQSGR